MFSLIPLAVELTKKTDIQDLTFSQAFEGIYSTLESLRNEEEGKTQMVPLASTENGQAKKKRIRRITCKICGKKLKSLAGKHIKNHGLTTKEYHKIGKENALAKSQF